MIKVKNVLKKKKKLFENKQIVVSLLEDKQNFKFGEFDESKTHPFFNYISGLKVQFNITLWSFHPNLCFVRN